MNNQRKTKKELIEELEKLEMKLDRAEHFALLGHWEYDPVNQTTLWSSEMFHIHGLDPEKGVPSFRELAVMVHPDDRDLWENMIAQMTSTGVSKQIEYRIIRPDGECRRLLAHEAQHFSWGDKPLRFYGMLMDITDRKRVEEMLRVSQSRFSNLVESTSDWVWEIDEHDKFKYANPQIYNLLGYKPEEVIGKNFFDLMAPDEAKRVAAIFGPIKADRKSFSSLVNTILHKTGHLVVLETSGVPFFNANGAFRGYWGIDRDVTEHAQVEETLQYALEEAQHRTMEVTSLLKNLENSEERFRSVVETATDAIITTDVKGNIIFCNAASEKIFGYSPGEMIGISLIGLMPERYRTRVAQQNGLANYFASGQSKSLGGPVESSGLKKDGSEFPLELSVVSYSTKDGVFFVGIIRDITERKQSEKALRKSHSELKKAYSNLKTAQDRMLQQEKMASIGQLSAGIAHEVKNPLAIIVQGIEILEKGLKGNESFLKISSEIQKAAFRADKIVRGLMAFARQTPVRLVETDIINVIEATLGLVEHQFSLKNITVERKYASAGHRLMIDGNQMEQVFMNILLNAADAMPQGGVITIIMEPVEEPEGRRLQIIFSDTGIGMPEEKVGRIFDPFYTTKQKTGGVGLGLSVTKGIIDNHNGVIRAESVGGKGTKIIILLPY